MIKSSGSNYPLPCLIYSANTITKARGFRITQDRPTSELRTPHQGKEPTKMFDSENTYDGGAWRQYAVSTPWPRRTRQAVDHNTVQQLVPQLTSGQRYLFAVIVTTIIQELIFLARAGTTAHSATVADSTEGSNQSGVDEKIQNSFAANRILCQIFRCETPVDMAWAPITITAGVPNTDNSLLQALFADGETMTIEEERIIDAVVEHRLRSSQDIPANRSLRYLHQAFFGRSA